MDKQIASAESVDQAVTAGVAAPEPATQPKPDVPAASDPGRAARWAAKTRRHAQWLWGDVQNRWSMFRAKFWSSLGPVVAFAVAVGALLVVSGILIAIGVNWWSDGNSVCKNNDLGCHLGSDLISDLLLAAIGVALFLGREAAAARSWRETVKSRPEFLFEGWLSNLDGLTGAAARARADAPRAPAERPATGAAGLAKRAVPEPRHRPAADSVRATAIGRDDLARRIIIDLEKSHETQIIVGESGAGKTVLLMVIADELAKDRQVPIAITLRHGSSEDIEKSARRAFTDTVLGTTRFVGLWGRRARAKNYEQAEKWWNWLRQRKLITVLVDDLEKDAQNDPARRVQALERLAHQDLRVIVASRAYGVPSDYRRGRTDIDPIADDAVVADLRQIAQHASERPQLTVSASAEAASEAAIETFADTAHIGRTPYYLAIARVLADRGMFPHPDATVRDPRIALLDTYHDGLRDPTKLASDCGLRAETRERVLRQLETVAFVRVLGTRTETEIAAQAARWRRPPAGLTYQEGFDLARRLTILESHYDGEVRFAHPTTMAYFASRFLREDWAWGRRGWQELSKAPHFSALLTTALILSVAGDPEKVRWGCERLLERVGLDTADEGAVLRRDTNREPLGLCAAAAEMLVSIPDRDPALIERISKTARDVPVVGQRLTGEKRRVVAALGRLRAHEQIWEYAREHQEYPVRREASRVLVEVDDHHPTLIRKLGELIDRGVKECEGQPPRYLDDDAPVIDELKPVGWIFASLRMAATDPAGQLAGLQRQLIALSLNEEFTVQRGLEASVAQGFKLAALHNPGRHDRFALEMLDPKSGPGPKFWYSRVMLAQALTLQVVEQPDPLDPKEAARRSDVRDRVQKLATQDLHPFVRHTARLCLKVFDDRTSWDRWIWSDAAEIVTGVPAKLDREAAQLAADIVIALNLNAHQDAKMREVFGTATSLPACLAPGGTRAAILGVDRAPIDKCPLTHNGRCACPYLYNSTDLKVDARREVSRAFCRHQLSSPRPPAWQNDLSPDQLRDFWEGMGNLARS